jgi:hypothetical protein
MQFNRDSATFARLIERRRTFPAVVAAGWMVWRPVPGSRFVLSDRGYAILRNDREQWHGYAVSLAPDLMVVVAPVPRPVELVWDGDRWSVEGLVHHTVPDKEATGVNAAMWHFAHSEVYGKTEIDVVRASKDEKGDPNHYAALLEQAWLLGGPAGGRRANEDIVGRLGTFIRDSRPAEPTRMSIAEHFRWPGKPSGKPTPTTRADASTTSARPGRNDPCYCGSGKKFKLCHGANR